MTYTIQTTTTKDFQSFGLDVQLIDYCFTPRELQVNWTSEGENLFKMFDKSCEDILLEK